MMNATDSKLPTPALSSPQMPSNSRNLIKQSVDQQPKQESASAKASTLTSKMAFTIDHRNHSMTVTVSDGATGELLRKLTYDRGGVAPTSPKSTMGQKLDVRT